MLSAGRGLKLGQTHGETPALPKRGTRNRGALDSLLFIPLLLLISVPLATAWPYDYRYMYNCPGPEWNIMCRSCCEYDVIRCKCPLQGTPVGYAVPCCRNAINECDPCIIHPGCSIFENCKSCNNGTWGPRDNFFVNGKYCAECRPGWSGGDCLKCGGVIRKRQGHLVLESYPTNARCEWTIQVDQLFTIEFRFMMLSLEFDHSCRYDYVEVRDGDSINSRVIGRYCGNNRPAPIQSSGNSLHVLFVSDGYKNFDGFFATFQESSACSSSPCLHDGTCVLDTSYSFHCACLAGYTGRRCENVVGCRRPPVPTHGSTEGVFHHSGARVVFRCDPGFDLRGIRSAVCLADGTWSAPAPNCVPTVKFCAIPAKPTHGDHFLVYGPNDVLIALQYLCYRPYKLTGTPQRTCLHNNTWSGTPPTCVKVNNTLAKPDKDKGKGTEKDTEKVPETGSNNKDPERYAEEKEGGNRTSGEGSVGGTDPGSGRRNSTTADSEDKSRDSSLERVSGGGQDRQGGGEEETDRLSRVDDPETDDSLNAVERKDAEDGKLPPESPAEEHETPEPETGRDADQGVGQTTDVTEVAVSRDKGQGDREKKGEQIDESTRPDHVGPNDTKQRGDTFERYWETYEITTTDNSTKLFDANAVEHSSNITETNSLIEETVLPPRSNKTQYTPYRAGGEDLVKPTESTPGTDTTDSNRAPPVEDKRAEESEVKTREQSEEEKAENQSLSDKDCPPLPRLYHGYQELVPGLVPETVQFFCNHSYALSGDARRTCQPNGTWSGAQPLCVRACREPKVSELVRQRIQPPQAPSRKTPVHKFYSSALGKHALSAGPTKGPPVLSQLPQGYHHLYTHIEYECASAFYHHSGSARRTCLKTGKWSGRHVSCSPVCGKHPTFDSQKPAESQWPWMAAIYRRSSNAPGAPPKVDKTASLMGSLKKGSEGAGGGARSEVEEEASDWQLVCSGSLVNQRSVVVAAHCVTELGKMYPVDAAKLKVVMGKNYRSDTRETKGLQHLRVASISVHPNYDPLILDSDLAVIKLLDKARIGERVLPLCLPDTQGGEVVSRQGLVTGWAPVPDPRIGADEQARVGVVHLADVVPCERQYARNGVPVSVTDNMLCGRQKPDYSPSNICPADTGGILILPAPSSDPSHHRDSSLSMGGQEEGRGGWRLLGLVSFGYDQGECDPDLFTVYTHIANFKDWIESNMK